MLIPIFILKLYIATKTMTWVYAGHSYVYTSTWLIELSTSLRGRYIFCICLLPRQLVCGWMSSLNFNTLVAYNHTIYIMKNTHSFHFFETCFICIPYVILCLTNFLYFVHLSTPFFCLVVVLSMPQHWMCSAFEDHDVRFLGFGNYLQRQKKQWYCQYCVHGNKKNEYWVCACGWRHYEVIQLCGVV